MSYLPELRASLVRAAERQAREPAAARRRSQGWFGIVVAVGVAVAVAVLAIVLVGHGPHNPAVPSGSNPPASGPKVSPPPVTPNPTPAQWSLIQKARNEVVSRDRPCWPLLRLPAQAQGSPTPQMLAVLGVLRHPATGADELPPVFPHGLPADLYVKAVRLARDQDGEGMYILPVANLGFRAVPGRCFAEERTALERTMKGSPPAKIQAAVDVQQRYLTWQQYQARHPEEVCLAEADHRRVHGQLQYAGGVGCGWGISDIEAGLAGLGSHGPGSLLHGIAPDGVARVTLVLPRGFQAITVRPVNNVYLTQLPHGVSLPTRIILRAADGAVIRTTRVP